MSYPVEALESRCLCAAGTPDQSFGANGTALVRDFGAGHKHAVRVLQVEVDAAGRTLILSRSNVSTTVTRLTVDGALDTSFATPATNNQVVLPNGNGIFGRMAVDDSNRVYVLGSDGVTRVTSRGKIDRTYGRRGFAGLSGSGRKNAFPKMRLGYDLVVDSDYAVTVAASYAVTSAGQGSAQKIARLTPAGVFDKSFDGDGVFDVQIPGDGSADGAELKIIPGVGLQYAADAYYYRRGELRQGAQVVRFLDNGVLDAKGAINDGYAGGAGQAFVPSSDGLDHIEPDGSVILRTRQVIIGDYHDTTIFGYKKLAADGVALSAFRPFQDGAPVNATPLTTGADGSKWVYLHSPEKGTTLYHVLPDGTNDPAFHGGEPLRDFDAVTVGLDGSIVIADSGSSGSTTDTYADQKFSITRLYPDEGPLAQLGPTVLTSAAQNLAFKVVWRDDDGRIDTATLGDDDLYASFAGIPVDIEFVSSVNLPNGTTVASYQAIGPWAAGDNGALTLRVSGTGVRDAGGVASGDRRIGTIPIAVPL